MTTRSDLYSRVFGKAVFPMLDRINGTTINRKLHALLSTEQTEPTELQAVQASKLSAAVRYSREHCDFYRSFWKNTRRGLPSLHAALEGLPVVTKEDLKAAGNAFPCPGYRGRVVVSRTSGSTGSPMVFYRSMEQESWFWAIRLRMWSWAGYQPGDPYLAINLNPRAGGRKRVQDVLFRCTYLTFNADNQDSRRIYELLASNRARFINGFASSLYVLARYMSEYGLSNPGVEGVMSTGDTLYPVYRETIERAFGTRVLDYYGAGGEGVHLASQCPESGERYHVHPENAVLEILGRDGPVPPGTPGRLVVTQLDNDVMPLIRYEIGDVGVAASEAARCECGRTLPMLESIGGRVPDLIVTRDGAFLVPHFFVVLFKNLQSVEVYQVIQKESERIVIRLVGRTGVRRTDVEATIRKEIGAATHDALTVGFEWVDEIPLSGAGKRRLVISDVARNFLAGGNSDPTSPGGVSR